MTANGSSRPRVFTPQVFSLISSLVDQGLGAREIAAQIGCKLSSLRVRCSQQGISLRGRSKSVADAERKPERRLTIHLYGSTVLRLQQHARSRGISSTSFAAALLEAITQDNLYDAILDKEAAASYANDDKIAGKLGKSHARPMSDRSQRRTRRAEPAPPQPIL